MNFTNVNKSIIEFVKEMIIIKPPPKKNKNEITIVLRKNPKNKERYIDYNCI